MSKFNLLIKNLSLVLLFSMPIMTAAQSFPCYIQFAKQDCWQGYDVTIQLFDAPTQTPIGGPIVLSKDKFNVLKSFTCIPNQQISAEAKFSPAIWTASKDAKYNIKKFWNVPMTLPANIDKWIIKVCFAKDFHSVPIPPTGAGDCNCTFPEVEQKIEYKIETIIKKEHKK